MRVTERNYPHPVLSDMSDDFVVSTFDCDTKEKFSDRRESVLEFTFSTNNVELLRLVDENRAFFAVHIECPLTRRRMIAKASGDKVSVTLQKKEYKDKIEICSFLISSVTMNDYYNSDFNTEYRGSRFRVEKGARLAIGTQFEIRIDEEETLEASEQFFVIQKNTQPSAPPLQVMSDRDIVIVQLSPVNFEICKVVHRNFTSYIEAAIGLPVLTYLLEKLKRGDDDDRRWARIVQKKLEALSVSLDDEDSLVIANRLLTDPITRGFVMLKREFMNQTFDDED